MEQKKPNTYEDIIHLPRHQSRKHAPMPRLSRAAQFAPFAALTGHKEAVYEKERITSSKKILDETENIRLNEELQKILLHIKKRPRIKVTYFEPDIYKHGGEYITIYKNIKRIDDVAHILHFEDQARISIEDICEIEMLED